MSLTRARLAELHAGARKKIESGLRLLYPKVRAPRMMVLLNEDTAHTVGDKDIYHGVLALSIFVGLSKTKMGDIDLPAVVIAYLTDRKKRKSINGVL